MLDEALVFLIKWTSFGLREALVVLSWYRKSIVITFNCKEIND